MHSTKNVSADCTYEEQYLDACLRRDIPSIYRLADLLPHDFNLNPVLTLPNGSRRTFAADLILQGNVGKFLELSRCFPERFKLHQVCEKDVFNDFHAGCVIHYEPLVVAGIDRGIDVNAPVRLIFENNNFAEITPFALAMLNINDWRTTCKDAEEIMQFLVRHGANPACFVKVTGSSAFSLFFIAQEKKEFFDFYVNLLKASGENVLFNYLDYAIPYSSDTSNLSINILGETIIKFLTRINEVQPGVTVSEGVPEEIVISDQTKDSMRRMFDLYRKEWLPEKSRRDRRCVPNWLETDTWMSRSLEAGDRQRAHLINYQITIYEQVTRLFERISSNARATKLKVKVRWLEAFPEVSYFRKQYPWAVIETPMADNPIVPPDAFERADQWVSPSLPEVLTQTVDFKSYPGTKNIYQASMVQDLYPLFGPWIGHTPMTWAAYKNNTHFLFVAITEGHCDLNVPVAFGPMAGMTPLLIALCIGQKESANLLLNYFVGNKNIPIDFYMAPCDGVLSGLSIKVAVEIFGDVNAKKLMLRVGYRELLKRVEEIDALKKLYDENYEDAVSALHQLDSFLQDRCVQLGIKVFDLGEEVIEIYKKMYLTLWPEKYNEILMLERFQKLSENKISGEDIETFIMSDILGAKIVPPGNNQRQSVRATSQPVAESSKPRKNRVKVKLAPDKKPEVAKIETTEENVSRDVRAAHIQDSVAAFNDGLMQAQETSKVNYEQVKDFASAVLTEAYNQLQALEIFEAKVFDEAALQRCEEEGEKLRKMRLAFTEALKPIAKATKAKKEVFDYRQYQTHDDCEASTSTTIEPVALEVQPENKAPKPTSLDARTGGIRLEKKEINDFKPKAKVRNGKSRSGAKKVVMSLDELARFAERTSVPSVALTKQDKDQLLLCLDNFEQLAVMRAEYEGYCVANNRQGIFDANTMLLVCSMEQKLITIYEILRALQIEREITIFADKALAEKLRNLTIHGGLVYYFKAESLSALLAFTFEVLQGSITKLANHRAINPITTEQVKEELAAFLQERYTLNDRDLLRARYQMMFDILGEWGKSHAKLKAHAGMTDEDSKCAGAQLFCLALIGTMLKNASEFWRQDFSLPKNYSQHLQTHIVHARPQGSRLYQQPRDTPLLTYFEGMARLPDGREQIKAMISHLSKEDMILLLLEISILQRHKTEDVWVSLRNPHLNEFIDLMAKRAGALHIEANHQLLSRNLPDFNLEQTLAAKALYEKWLKAPPFNDLARKDETYTNLLNALSDIAANDCVEGMWKISALLQVLPGFKSKYLWSEKDMSAVSEVQQLLQSCMDWRLGLAPLGACHPGNRR